MAEGLGQAPAAQVEGLAPSAETSDAALVAASLAGDAGAFERLLERHYARIHRLAWRQTGSPDEAEDIAQDVCCALVTKLGSFRGEARFTTWLGGIVINACRDHFRRRSAQTRLKQGVAAMMELTPLPDGRDLYRRSWLESDLARLDEGLRETVILVAGEELSHAEAASILGVAESTISWRMHEARRKLKQIDESTTDGA